MFFERRFLIILADEPTGILDSLAAREIAQLLKKISKNKLIIVVIRHVRNGTMKRRAKNFLNPKNNLTPSTFKKKLTYIYLLWYHTQARKEEADCFTPWPILNLRVSRICV